MNNEIFQMNHNAESDLNLKLTTEYESAVSY